MTRALARDFVTAVCAVSAGVHAALVPEHVREEPVLGGAFVVSVGLLAATAVALAHWPESMWPPRAAATLFVGLVVAYATTRTVHLPALETTPEGLDGVGLATNLVETAGLVPALCLVRSDRSSPSVRAIPLPLAGLVAVFSALLVLSLSAGHTAH